MFHPRFLTTCVFLPAILLPLALDWRWLWLAIMLPGCIILSVYELSSMLIPVMDNLDRGSQKSTASHLPSNIWKTWLIISCLILTSLLISPISVGPVVVGASLWFVTISLFFARDPSAGVHRLFVSITSVLYGCLPWLSLWYLFQIERSHEIHDFHYCCGNGQ